MRAIIAYILLAVILTTLMNLYVFNYIQFRTSEDTTPWVKPAPWAALINHNGDYQ